MNISDALLLVLRWVHAIAAVAWVGGGAVYLLVVRPAFRASGGDDPARQAAMRDFRGLLDLAMWMLLITGAVLSFDSLTSGFVGVTYFAVLAVKVALALYSFAVIRSMQRRRAGGGRIGRLLTGVEGVVVAGVVIILLADVLRYIYERGLTS